VTKLLLALLAVAIPLVQVLIDARLGTTRSQEEVLYLWRGEHVKRLFPGFETLAADVYWLRTVQYFGSQRLFASGRKFDLLRPLIEITTSLDPRLEIAYRYGAIFLCEPPPVGAGMPEEGLAILEKGTKANPRSWRLWQERGFYTYLYLDDPKGAAAILQEAARLPGAPFWLGAMAADILAEGGDRTKARRMWEQMYAQSEAGVLRSNAEMRIEMLDALDLADAVARQVEEFRRQEGHRPAHLEELTARGLWKGPVVEPSGQPFDYDASTGKVQISRASRLWRPAKRPRP
jgi:hypothetical protein